MAADNTQVTKGVLQFEGGGEVGFTCDLAEVFFVGVPEIGAVLWKSQEEMECLPHVQKVIICEGIPSHGHRRVYHRYGTVL